MYKRHAGEPWWQDEDIHNFHGKTFGWGSPVLASIAFGTGTYLIVVLGYCSTFIGI